MKLVIWNATAHTCVSWRHCNVNIGVPLYVNHDVTYYEKTYTEIICRKDSPIYVSKHVTAGFLIVWITNRSVINPWQLKCCNNLKLKPFQLREFNWI